MTGKADPYVQVHLLPGSHEMVKTKVVKKNYNPMFNETFTFPVSSTDVATKTVVLQVIFTYSGSFISQIIISLSGY